MLTSLQRANLAERARMVGRLAAVVVSISLVACVMRSPVAPAAPAARATAPAPATAAAPAVEAPALAAPAAMATSVTAAAAPAPAGCTLRVIVSFAESGVAPASAVLQDISHAARVDLTYVRSLTPELHLFVLRAADSGDPDCELALGRLRSDPRVRSADIDVRRQPQR